MADVYQWTGNSNADIGSQANWFDESNPGMGTVPGVNDVAIIQVGQGIFGTLNVASMDIVQSSGAPIVSIIGSSTAVTATALNIAEGFTLDTGAFLQSTDLSIDGSGSVITVQNGSYLYVAGDQNNNLDIGATTGSTKMLVTKGSIFTYTSNSSSGTLNVGDYNGNVTTLTFNGGAYFDSTVSQFSVGAVGGSTGIVNVTGAGTQFLCDDNGYTNIGDFGEETSSAQGTFSVSGGAYASLVALGQMDIGTTGGMAKIIVSGANSDISAGPYVEIGTYQSNIAGEILVQAGGEFDTATDPSLNNGTISVAGAGSLFTGRILSVDSGCVVQASTGGSIRLADVELAGTMKLSAGNVDVRSQLYLYSGGEITGAGTISAVTAVNNGLIVASGGTLTLESSLSGTGAVHIVSSGTFDLTGAAVASQTIQFGSGVDALLLGDAAKVAAHITDFASGDAIDLLADPATRLSYSPGALTVLNGTTQVAKLAIKGAYNGAGFTLASDGHGGSLIAYASPNGVREMPPMGFEHHSITMV